MLTPAWDTCYDSLWKIEPSGGLQGSLVKYFRLLHLVAFVLHNPIFSFYLQDHKVAHPNLHPSVRCEGWWVLGFVLDAMPSLGSLFGAAASRSSPSSIGGSFLFKNCSSLLWPPFNWVSIISSLTQEWRGWKISNNSSIQQPQSWTTIIMS